MQEIDSLIDEKPALALEMVELDIRNKQAHTELQAYNDCSVFVYKHPFTKNRKAYDDEMSRLYDMKKTDPEAFLKEIENIGQNIRRIKSNLKQKKYKSEEEHEAWQQNLSRAEMKQKILQEVISK
jgi:flagellar motility protein MotE (MotC chaperone)